MFTRILALLSGDDNALLATSNKTGGLNAVTIEMLPLLLLLLLLILLLLFVLLLLLAQLVLLLVLAVVANVLPVPVVVVVHRRDDKNRDTESPIAKLNDVPLLRCVPRLC